MRLFNNKIDLRLFVVASFLALRTTISLAEQPFEFVDSYDAGIVSGSADIGWMGVTNRDGNIIVTSGEAATLFEFTHSMGRLELRPKCIVQNKWTAKERPVGEAKTTDAPITAPYSGVLSPDDRFLYTNGVGTMEFPASYARDQKSGVLAPIALSQEQISAGAGLPPAQRADNFSRWPLDICRSAPYAPRLRAQSRNRDAQAGAGY